jgi:hypothetical protein
MAGEFGKLQPVQFVAIAIGLTLSACAGRDPQPIATVQALLANHHRRRAGENRPQPFAGKRSKNPATFVYGFVDREECGYLTHWQNLGTSDIMADTPSAKTSGSSPV